MGENMIYKMVFEEIKDSREWSSGCKDTTYSWYIDGVISLAERMLEKLEEPTETEHSEDICHGSRTTIVTQ